MTSADYRAAAGRMEDIRRELLAVSREQALGARERVAAVLSGAAAGFLTDRLEQCGRELAAAAHVLEEAAAAARRTAQTLEAAEVMAAAPAPVVDEDGEEEPFAETPAPVAKPNFEESPDADFPVPDLLSRIRAEKTPPTYVP